MKRLNRRILATVPEPRIRTRFMKGKKKKAHKIRITKEELSKCLD